MSQDVSIFVWERSVSSPRRTCLCNIICQHVWQWHLLSWKLFACWAWQTNLCLPLLVPGICFFLYLFIQQPASNFFFFTNYFVLCLIRLTTDVWILMAIKFSPIFMTFQYLRLCMLGFYIQKRRKVFPSHQHKQFLINMDSWYPGTRTLNMARINKPKPGRGPKLIWANGHLLNSDASWWA